MSTLAPARSKRSISKETVFDSIKDIVNSPVATIAHQRKLVVGTLARLLSDEGVSRSQIDAALEDFLETPMMTPMYRSRNIAGNILRLLDGEEFPPVTATEPPLVEASWEEIRRGFILVRPACGTRIPVESTGQIVAVVVDRGTVNAGGIIQSIGKWKAAGYQPMMRW